MSGGNDLNVRDLTPAQSDHIRRLYATFEQAQRELNDFASYLMAEHGIGNPEEWQLSRDLTRFEKMKQPGQGADSEAI